MSSITYSVEQVERNYREGVLHGEQIAEIVRRDGLASIGRETDLREEADAYRLPTQAARNLRAYTLGVARGYRHGTWEVR